MWTKSLYDNNGGGQREKVKRVEQVSRWHCIFHPQLWVENRDMCSRKQSNELFSGQEIGKTRMLQSEESRQNPSRSFWATKQWGRRSIWTKSRKGVREDCENFREIVKRKGVDVFWRDLVERSPCENLWCEGHPSDPVYAIGMAEDLYQVLWDQKVKRTIFMRAVSKRNFSSAKYGKFRWPQGKRSWSFTRATRKNERCCVDPCWDWDTFGPRWKCSFMLWMAQWCGASSWTYHELSLHSFFLGFHKLHVEVWFFFTSFYFVWVLAIFLDPYNHDSLLSS